MKISEIFDMCETCNFDIKVISRMIVYFYGSDASKEIKFFAGEIVLNKRHLDDFKISDENTSICRKLCLILEDLQFNSRTI